MPATIFFYISLLSPWTSIYHPYVIILTTQTRSRYHRLRRNNRDSCKNANLTLLSLQHANHFSSRPFVKLEGLNGTSQIVQLLRDGNVYLYVRLIEKFLPGRFLTFLIRNKFYTLQNYTL